MEAWWEDEHYATDGSSSSAGEHKKGSGRAYVGTSSQLSNPEEGRLFLNSTDSAVWGAFSSSTWERVASDVQLDSKQTWTELQEFTSGVSASDGTFGDISVADIQGVVSGASTLASTRTVNTDDVNQLQMRVDASGVTFSDVVSVGFQDSSIPSGAHPLATGQVLSNGSIGVIFYNPFGSSTISLGAGTEVRYTVFKHS